MQIELIEFRVAGIPYYDYEECIEAGDPTGEVCELVLEPANKHDSNALEVYCGDYKLGYVPRDHNRIIGNLMKQKDLCTVMARIKEIDYDLDSVIVSVWIEVELK